MPPWRIVGFTGTRRGMTQAQREGFQDVIRRLEPVAFHHGDCKGADDEADELVCKMKPRVHRVIRPGPDEDQRAFCSFKRPEPKAAVFPPKTHFARNREIVDNVNVMIACPPTEERQETGGTWYTVDYSRKTGRELYLILPSGKIVHETP